MLDWQSLNLDQERTEQLQRLFPEIFSEGKIDPAQLKKYFGEYYEGEERYGINRAGKNSAIQVIKHRTSHTLHPDKESSVDRENTGNIFIEGDNLDALRILQKSYYGKIKMIYIDPPYNTGNDNFVYPDDFSQTQKEYAKASGQVDEEGNLKKADFWKSNTKDSGKYHSNWLGMMYPRLFLAKNLLKEDGVIFVSIDDHEVHNLRMIMNELFGEENCLWQMVWHCRWRSKTALSIDHEYILCYAKNKENIVPIFDTKWKVGNRYGQYIERKYSNPDNDPRGDWRDCQHTVTKQKAHYTYSVNRFTGEIVTGMKSDLEWYYHETWMYPPETIKKLFKDNRLFFTENMNEKKLALKVKKFKTEEETVSALEWLVQRDFVSSRNWSEEFDKLFSEYKIFNYPKPTRLIKRLLSSCTIKDDIVLDFFAWSWTTAHAVMDLNSEDEGNRKFILVQYPELTDESSEAYKAWYKKISDICKERIRRAGKKIKEEKGLLTENLNIGFKAFVVDESNFKVRRSEAINDQTLLSQLDLFTNNTKVGTDKLSMLYELMLKRWVDLNTKVSPSSFNEYSYYHLGEWELIVCLDEKVDQKLVDHFIELKPQMVVMLDKAFAWNDQLLVNTDLQMKSKDITFQTL